MKIKRHLKKITVLLISLGIVMSMPLISSAEESLSITNWVVDSQLLENGDLSVVEDITFRFEDQYNGVFREIVLEDTSGIEEIRVVENSKDNVLEYSKVEKAKKGDHHVFLVNEDNDRVVLQIFSPSEDEEKTFRIIYTVKDVAKKYRDIGELYYKFLGDENETPIGLFTINIGLPYADEKNEVKVFAHGPLNGEIHKTSKNTIYLRVEDVPKDTYIEGRILFPKEFIPNSKNIIHKDGYSDILREEARLQEKIETDRVKREFRGRLFGDISIGLSAVEAVFFIFLAIKTRRVKDLHTEGRALNVPEDCTPGIATYITSAMISTETIIATILDLYRKGYIKVEDGKEFQKEKEILKDFTIIKVKEEDQHLLSHEKHFIHWLIHSIGNGVSVTTKDIESYSKKNSALYTEHYSKWVQLIKEDAVHKGYFDHSTKKYGKLLLILAIISFVVAIITLIHENLLGLIPLFMAILLLIQGILLLSRKSDRGYEQYKKWTAFKKHMKQLQKDDKSHTADQYPKDMILIYGLAFGMDQDILNTIQMDLTGREDFNSYSYGWMYWYFLLNSNRNNVFNQSINNSFSGSASSVGGGGSFTAGGGGGAGGGGAGGF